MDGDLLVHPLTMYVSRVEGSAEVHACGATLLRAAIRGLPVARALSISYALACTRVFITP